MTLTDILARNLGNVLTPELLRGIVAAYVDAVPEVVCASLPLHASPPPSPCAHPRILTNDRARVGAWVARQIGRQGAWGDFGAIGLLDMGLNELVAGGVLHELTDTGAMVHIAVGHKHAMTRAMVVALCDYAFCTLDLERVTGLIDADNADSLRFSHHLGFEQEHIMRNANAGDVIMMTMWRDRCRWIKRG